MFTGVGSITGLSLKSQREDDKGRCPTVYPYSQADEKQEAMQLPSHSACGVQAEVVGSMTKTVPIYLAQVAQVYGIKKLKQRIKAFMNLSWLFMRNQTATLN